MGVDCAQVFAIFDMAGYWLAIQLKFLPIYALSCRVCPASVEATMVALVYHLRVISIYPDRNPDLTEIYIRF